MTFDYDQLDPGIRNTVRRLHGWGFATCDSGDGSKADTMECAVSEPMIAIVVSPEDLVRESLRLADCLRVHGVHLETIGDDGPNIQATFDPADQSSVILLFNVHDGTWSEVMS